MPWSHRMIHGPSGAGTRSKTTASSSPFQHIQEWPVSMSYEKVMTETVTTCLLNPRATWQLSWERIATWGRPWRQCVQRGDVLIIGAKGYVVCWSVVALGVDRRSGSMREEGKRVAQDFFLFVPIAFVERVPYFFSNSCAGAWTCLSAGL